MNAANMYYANVLQDFKLDWEAYQALKEEDAPKAPTINDKDNDRKVIKWSPIFKDALSRTFGHTGPLIYVLRENVAVEPEALDPLNVNDTTGVVNSYHGKSGSLQDELYMRLPHTGPK